jgi:hypothetical protein
VSVDVHFDPCPLCRWWDNAVAGVVTPPPELTVELARRHERCGAWRDARIEALAAMAQAGTDATAN